MEKKRNIIQVYATLINVVVVIAILIAITGLVTSIIDRADPINAAMFHQENLSSFEKYKMDVLSKTTENAVFIPSQDELKTMYEAARQSKIDKVYHETFKGLLNGSIIIFIGLVLFVIHWRILKKEQLKDGT